MVKHPSYALRLGLLVSAGLLATVLLAGLTANSAGWPLLLIVAAIFGLVIFLTPFWIAIGLAFAVALSPELPLGLPLRIEDFVLAGGLAILALRLLLSRQPVPPVPNWRPWLALLGVELVATVLGVLQGTTRFDLSVYSGGVFLAKSIETFLLFAVVVWLLDTPAKVKLFVWAYLLAGAGLAGVGAFNQLTGRSHIPGVVVDIEGGPTYSLMALALMPPLALGIAFWISHTPRNRWLIGWLDIPVIYSFVFTLSRQAYIGVGVMLSMMIWIYNRRWLFLAVPLLVLLAFVPNMLPQSITIRTATLIDPFTGEDIGFGVYSTRLNAWQQRFPEMVASNPITGRGLASLPPGYLDSQYLVVLYYTGFVGLAVYMGLLAAFGRLAWRLYQKDNTPLGQALGLAGVGIVIGFTVASFGGSPFVAVRAREMFWLLMAAIAAYAQLGERFREKPAG
ncbi:MAG: hypothetical protein FOGNACKC_03201 [Anaerolineae bacterium]|nr:hypothetical protein [Anaerolineae bacterium]